MRASVAKHIELHKLSGYELVGSVVKVCGKWYKVVGWLGRDKYHVTWWCPSLSPGTRTVYTVTI